MGVTLRRLVAGEFWAAAGDLGAALVVVDLDEVASSFGVTDWTTAPVVGFGSRARVAGGILTGK